MTREGVCDECQSNRYDFAYNRRCFLGTLRGYFHALNRKNPVSAISVKKGDDLFLNKELVPKEILEIPRIVDHEESISDYEYLLELNPKSKRLHQLRDLCRTDIYKKSKNPTHIRTSL
jgi:hypothetical protein